MGWFSSISRRGLVERCRFFGWKSLKALRGYCMIDFHLLCSSPADGQRQEPMKDCTTLIVRLFMVCHFASAGSRQLIRQRLRIREPPSWPFVLMSIRTLIETNRMSDTTNFISDHVQTELVTEQVRNKIAICHDVVAGTCTKAETWC